MERPWGTVYTVREYWDGPRAGIADFDGAPHAYRWVDDEPEHGTFLLWTVSDEVFALAREDWEIWNRWQDAFYARETTIDTHPALPADTARHREIIPVIEQALRPPADGCRTVTARFRATQDGRAQHGWMPELDVRWTPVEAKAENRVADR